MVNRSLTIFILFFVILSNCFEVSAKEIVEFRILLEGRNPVSMQQCLKSVNKKKYVYSIGSIYLQLNCVARI